MLARVACSIFLACPSSCAFSDTNSNPWFVAQRDAAITSPIPGTTRDVLTLTLDIGGFPVILSDTAGLRETLETVEQVGVGRAGNAYVQVILHYPFVNDSLSVKEADLSLCVLSLPDVLSSRDNALVRVPDEVKSHLKLDTLFLLNKSDTIASLPPNQSLTFTEYGDNYDHSRQPQFWTASLRTSEGTQSFLDGLAQVLRSRYLTQVRYLLAVWPYWPSLIDTAMVSTTQAHLSRMPVIEIFLSELSCTWKSSSPSVSTFVMLHWCIMSMSARPHSSFGSGHRRGVPTLCSSCDWFCFWTRCRCWGSSGRDIRIVLRRQMIVWFVDVHLDQSQPSGKHDRTEIWYLFNSHFSFTDIHT